MTALSFTAKKISPLPGAIVREFTLGSAAGVGDLVFIASDGYVDPTDADAATALATVGIIVAIGGEGAESGDAGDRCSVVVFGPVGGFSGLTPGEFGYASATAGDIEDAPAGTGDYYLVAGVCIATDVFHVNIWSPDVAAQ